MGRKESNQTNKTNTLLFGDATENGAGNDASKRYSMVRTIFGV